jgi:hypothetical protein
MKTGNNVDLWIKTTQEAWTHREGYHLIEENVREIIYGQGLEKILSEDIELDIKFLGSVNSSKMTERHYEIRFIDYTCRNGKQVVCATYLCKREKIQ